MFFRKNGVKSARKKNKTHNIFYMNFSAARVFENAKTYISTDFKHDLIAGIVVGLIALPLAIAFAVASGARPEQGIYTSIIAGILIGVLSGSKFQIAGPTGAFIVILLGVVNKFGMDGLLMAGCMAGIILLLMGIFKLGTVIKFIPYPVTVGFTSGIGVIIFSGEIKDFFGLTLARRPQDFIETIELLTKGFAQGIHTSSVIIGAVTLAVFLLWKKYGTSFPPAPIALAAGIITSLVITYGFKNSLPAPLLVGNIPAGLPQFHTFDISYAKIKLLIPSAFTIAMLGAIESLLSAVVADGMTGTKHDSNRELIAQGIGNMVLPFFGGIPATGAIARTAANIRNGGRTRMSSVIHGLTLLLILLVAAPYAKEIPLAALAAILIMVAYNMAEIPHFMRLLKSPRQDVIVLVTTFLLTVFIDLTVAVGAGIVLAATFFIQQASTGSVQKIMDDPDAPPSDTSLKLHTQFEAHPKIHLYELQGPLFFGVASELENSIEHRPGEILILRMKHMHHIDASAANTIEMLIDRVQKNHGYVFLSTLHPEAYKELIDVGLIKKLRGEWYVTERTTIAIQRAKELLEKPTK